MVLSEIDITLVSGTCGGGTYIDIKKVRVKDQNFIASFQVPTVSETQQIQSQYLQGNPQRTDIQDKVPWGYIDVQVSGFPSHQEEPIIQQIGAQGMNLTGTNVILKPQSKNREAYKMIRWNTTVKMSSLLYFAKNLYPRSATKRSYADQSS